MGLGWSKTRVGISITSLWDLLSKKTDEQIDKSHLTDALDGYVVEETLQKYVPYTTGDNIATRKGKSFLLKDQEGNQYILSQLVDGNIQVGDKGLTPNIVTKDQVLVNNVALPTATQLTDSLSRLSAVEVSVKKSNYIVVETVAERDSLTPSKGVLCCVNSDETQNQAQTLYLFNGESWDIKNI